MISIAATPVAGRAGGHASSSRRAQAANALSSARSAAVSGGDAIAVLVLVVLVVTGARDQRRRLRSAALDILVGRSDRAASYAIDANDASTQNSSTALFLVSYDR